MSATCITCGGEVDAMPDLMWAKARFGLPLTPPKRCAKCLWSSLRSLKAGDEDDGGSESPGDRHAKDRGTE